VALEIDRISSAKSIAQSQLTIGIDLYFLVRAIGKKQIVELESYNFEQQILYDQTEDMQVRYLKATLDRVESAIIQKRKIKEQRLSFCSF
jgi:uncharacterized protein YbaP (TraB family)